VWHQRYILLLWLSLICMLPFDLAVLDSDTGIESDAAKILTVAKRYLVATDKAREGASVLVSRLVTRPDMQQVLLPTFLAWTQAELSAADPTDVRGMVALTGLLSALATVFKLGKRQDLLPCAAPLLQRLDVCGFAECPNTLLRKLAAKLVQRLGLVFLEPRLAPWRYQRGSRSLLSTAAGAAAATATAAATADGGDGGGGNGGDGGGDDGDDDDDYDVPEELESVIELLLVALRDKDTVVRWSAAKGIGRITGRLPLEFADDVVGTVLEMCSVGESDGAWHGACLALAELGRRGLLLPSRLGEVVPVILNALAYDEMRGAYSVGAHVRDAACYVAWAFARAYEPAIIAPFIQQIARALLVVTTFDREVNVRRAASAAFQENVGRQGTLSHGIDIVTAADFFAVGIRSNAYLEISVYIAQFPEYTHAMVDHLVDVKLEHWDRAIRELAAQALSRLCARCPEYVREQLRSKVVKYALSADLNARHGSVLALGHAVSALAKLHAAGACTATNATTTAAEPEPEPQADVDADVDADADADVDAESFEVWLGEELVTGLHGLVDALNTKAAFRGMGGEMIRAAICSTIGNLAGAGLPFGKTAVVQVWQATLDDNLLYDETAIQDLAGIAVAALATACYTGLGAEDLAAVQETVILGGYLAQLASAPTPRAQRGLCLVLGLLPAAVVGVACFDAVLNSLLAASTLPETKSEPSTEARRVALVAATSLVLQPPPLPAAAVAVVRSDGGGGGSAAAATAADTDEAAAAAAAATLLWVAGRGRASEVLEALYSGADDYTIESRGDIGSMVREECMHCLERLAYWLIAGDASVAAAAAAAAAGQEEEEEEEAVSAETFTAKVCSKIVCILVQQSMEKIDRTRAHSGKILVRMLRTTVPTAVPHFMHRAEMTAIFDAADAEGAALDWLAPSASFPAMVQLLKLDGYRQAALTGLVVSVGGLTESLVRHSSASLLDVVFEFEEAELEAFCKTLMEIMVSHLQQDRVVVPLLKTVDLLLSNGCLEPVLDEAHSFGVELFEQCQEELKKCSDVNKISTAIDVICGLLAAEGPVQKRALSKLLILLCHRYPRVRKLTAEKIYTGLLAVDGVIPEANEDEVSTILTTTLWDAELPQAREHRNRICNLVGVAVPKKKAKSAAATAAAAAAAAAARAAKQDDLESYKDLVDRSGY